ncbi:hypothetical protein ACF0H5_002374 [Mactra antiquata]
MRPPSSEGPVRNRCQPVRRASTFRNSNKDKNAADMLRFVRDVQLERQNTTTGFCVKAPLPGISNKFVKHNSFDSGFVERATENTDSDDDSFDINMPVIGEPKPRVDSELVGMLKNPKCVNRNSNDHHVLSKFQQSRNLDFANNNGDCRRHSVMASEQTTSKKPKVNITKSRTARLPPLEREQFLDRPSAPSPSRTLSDYSDYNDSESDY